MNKNLVVAEYIKELRTGNVIHSARRISELVCQKYPQWIKERDEEGLDGNQLHGQDLIQWAADYLGISPEDFDKDWL